MSLPFKLPRCSICGYPEWHYVCHHWFEPYLDGGRVKFKGRVSWACTSCNNALTARNVWGADLADSLLVGFGHVLPRLVLQRTYRIRTLRYVFDDVFSKRLRSAYSFLFDLSTQGRDLKSVVHPDVAPYLRLIAAHSYNDKYHCRKLLPCWLEKDNNPFLVVVHSIVSEKEGVVPIVPAEKDDDYEYEGWVDIMRQVRKSASVFRHAYDVVLSAVMKEQRVWEYRISREQERNRRKWERKWNQS